MTVDSRKSWIDQVLSPRVSDDHLREKLEEARQQMPLPVFWLMGKTQSGKTSIVQALTGSSRAEIGKGFQPCTKRTEVFDFPNAETAFVRFLDTKGLGEVGYDPQADMEWCQQNAHLLMVVIKAMDHELDAVLTAVRLVQSRHTELPVLVVQTCLHEGYPNKAMDHIAPYPFDDERLKRQLPADLLRSLVVQRQLFQGCNAKFVAVDFTLETDGYTPLYYGIEELWMQIESTLQQGIKLMLLKNQHYICELNNVYTKHAHSHALAYALSSGVLALTPIPIVSVPLVIGIQGKLFQSIASIFGLTLTRRSVYEVASAVGIGGICVGIGARELAKLIPGWGSVVSGLTTAAVTYALGMTMCFYYMKTLQGETFTSTMLKSVYDDQLVRGKELLKERFK